MGMQVLQDYSIEIFNLKNITYNYSYEIDHNFFALFEESLLDNGEAKVNLVLAKTDTFININFNIEGIIELTCDRTLEKFDYHLDIQKELIFRFGEEEKELDERLIQITRMTSDINVARFIYEFISLSIPMKKLHPRFETQQDELLESNTFVYSSLSKDMQTDKGEEKAADPRWDKLKGLKDN